jgi:hypothetical protein
MTSMSICIVALIAMMRLVIAASPPLFHPPSWTVPLSPQEATVATAVATNDYAAYAVVNNSVTSYDGFTGSTRWVNNVSGDFAGVQVTANNKWVVVQTGTDFFVFDASSGVLASQSQNFTYTFLDNNIVPTQFDDVFIGIDADRKAMIARVMPAGVLQRVWEGDVYDVDAVGVLPNTPCMYVVANGGGLYTLDIVNMSSLAVIGSYRVLGVSKAPVDGRIAVIWGDGALGMIDVMRGMEIVWNNTLAGACSTIADATTTFIYQTGVSVLLTTYSLVSMIATPLFVVNSATGAVTGNHTDGPSGYSYTPMFVTEVGGLVVMLAQAASGRPIDRLIVLNPVTGDQIGAANIPMLMPAVALSTGGGGILVPNRQGFTTLDVLDASVPLSYNLNLGGVTQAATYTSRWSSAMFVIADQSSISGFATTP